MPEVLAVSYDKTIYLQEDLGDISLLDMLEQKGYEEETYNLFRESLHQLARIQVDLGDEATKSGVSEEELPELVRAIGACGHLQLIGLMTLPPFLKMRKTPARIFVV